MKALMLSGVTPLKHEVITGGTQDLDRPELIDVRGATTTVTADQVRHLVTRAAGMRRVVDRGLWPLVTPLATLVGEFGDSPRTVANVDYC